jgi:hypothetical protein
MLLNIADVLDAASIAAIHNEIKTGGIFRRRRYLRWHETVKSEQASGAALAHRPKLRQFSPPVSAPHPKTHPVCCPVTGPLTRNPWTAPWAASNRSLLHLFLKNPETWRRSVIEAMTARCRRCAGLVLYPLTSSWRSHFR